MLYTFSRMGLTSAGPLLLGIVTTMHYLNRFRSLLNVCEINSSVSAKKPCAFSPSLPLLLRGRLSHRTHLGMKGFTPNNPSHSFSLE